MLLRLVLPAFGALLLGLVFIALPRDILVSDSPDRSHRIIVREGIRLIDRNFRVLLVDRPTGTERVVYTSEDQSPTNTHERFVWSKDSSKVVLVGDRYFVVPGSKLESGEIVFLMYDVNTDKLWCNEDHDRGFQRVSSQQVVDAFGEDFKREGANLRRHSCGIVASFNK
ncbi:MAG: hypothetical protein JWN70_5934 [Planctomycetaceae bacterium]|nr:hypothetical protein [Planctomycetaceae bacterium]